MSDVPKWAMDEAAAFFGPCATCTRPGSRTMECFVGWGEPNGKEIVEETECAECTEFRDQEIPRLARALVRVAERVRDQAAERASRIMRANDDDASPHQPVTCAGVAAGAAEAAETIRNMPLGEELATREERRG